MSSTTRRAFVQNSAAAAAGMTALGAIVAAQADAETVGHSAPVVAYVKDARKGEITVMSGDRTVSVRDRQLAARLSKTVR